MPLTFTKLQPAKSEPASLRYRLHKAIAQIRPGRDLKNVHASDITKQDSPFCPRRRVIQQLAGMEAPMERTSASMQMVFDLGNAVEDIVVRRAGDAFIAVGDWLCIRCGKRWYMTTKPPACRCSNEGGIVYQQRRFYSTHSGISCGVDMLASGVSDKLVLVEIKSIGKDDFRKLEAPLAEHRLRTNLYCRIISESNDEDRDRIDTTQGIVLYVDKGGFGIKDPEVANWPLPGHGFSPFKEFRVVRNDGDTEHYVQRARDYKKAMETKTICSGICSSPYQQEAKSCVVGGKCFSGVFPVGGAWG